MLYYLLLAKLRSLLCCLVCCWLLATNGLAQANSYEEDRAAWQQLKRQPITESNFRAVCDLMQRIGKTKLDTSYTMLAEYTPLVKATGNKQWTHILLMGWARAKESFGYFEEAEALYKQAKENADTGRLYREVIVATIFMYCEWHKLDSLYKYVHYGEQLFKQAGDKESLSFTYTFRTAPLLWANKRDSMKLCFDQAIQLAQDLPNKNALFVAKYNLANYYWRDNPQEQVQLFTELMDLADDSSLNQYPRKLYERTAFTFRNAKVSACYQLMQVCQLLADYASADKYAKKYYDLAIAPNPHGVQAPYFNVEIAIVSANQGKWTEARQYLDTALKLFGKPEADIPYPSYYLGAGLLAEHEGRKKDALQYFKTALEKGNTVGRHLVPLELYYGHSLVINGLLPEATAVFDKLPAYIATRSYSAPGLYYHKYYAELLKAKGDEKGYIRNLITYYDIKDSLNSFNRFRAVQEIQAKLDLKDKEQQIQRLHEEQVQREQSIRKERLFYVVSGILSVLAILFLILYLRNRQARNRQQQALQQSRLEQLQHQHRIEVMQGAMNAEENERRKIADQLHDEVNAMLALASLNVSSVLEKGASDEQAIKKLEKSYDIISSVATTIRDLSHRLTPLVIEKYGFKKAIEELGDAANLSEKIKVETVMVGFDDTRKYNVAFLNDLYRIIQELLHNILKHALAQNAFLEMVEHEKHISIMVEDDGIGIAEDLTEKGKGLKGIQSRIAYLNGKMEIARKQDNGTLIVIEITI